MLIPIVAIFVIVALVIIFALAKSHDHRMFSISTVLLWLIAVASAIPVVWAWKERAYSENWAMISVIFVSIPLILATIVLGAVFVLSARKGRVPNSRAMTLNLFLLGSVSHSSGVAHRPHRTLTIAVVRREAWANRVGPNRKAESSKQSLSNIP
jgi:hypothetical protein